MTYRHIAVRGLACLALSAGSLHLATAQASPRSPMTLARSFVLTRAQIGPGFSSTAEGFTARQLALQGTWTAAQLHAWGYKAGYERVFDHAIHTINGEQIASNAGVYKSAAGAEQSLLANGNQCTLGRWEVRAAPPHLGNDAVFCSETGYRDGREGQLFFLVWRIGRFKGSITLSGVIGHVKASQAVGLARRQAVMM